MGAKYAKKKGNNKKKLAFKKSHRTRHYSKGILVLSSIPNHIILDLDQLQDDIKPENAQKLSNQVTLHLLYLFGPLSNSNLLSRFVFNLNILKFWVRYHDSYLGFEGLMMCTVTIQEVDPDLPGLGQHYCVSCG